MGILDDAIAATQQTNGDDGVITGWALVTASTNLDTGNTGYTLHTPDGTPEHHTIGLLTIGTDLLGEMSTDED